MTKRRSGKKSTKAPRRCSPSCSGSDSPTDGNRNRPESPLDSRFLAPYSLTRLCFETGGVYFVVHPNRNTNRRVRRAEVDELASHLERFFEPEVMRRYRPDYVTQDQYEDLLSSNRARGGARGGGARGLAGADGAASVDVPGAQRGGLRRPTESRSAFGGQTRTAARAAVSNLERGRARPTIPDHAGRWQAGFDLAMGRVLAIKVRTQSYNAMLAQAKGGLEFPDPNHDTWRLAPENEVTVGSVLAKQAEAAREYLQAVVEKHPDTPWAYLAEKELQEPIGWRWVSRPHRRQRSAAGHGRRQ